ncbi:hypothetical protein CN138_08935 [Sinorhizobium meliloti]|uniref:hypothetical protein n=1 Tax=Rhizobium meliloti TaxID=382 RepID=UPI000FD4681C|nr:hypothetical protein [Sinorhizobium meliloti]RVL48445.1 hypothetical protein CN145_23055 [Sinorhizobium meliloti]RVL72379.1 hypothetical protein CN138_08935 [Sinorhizobium meliloti]
MNKEDRKDLVERLRNISRGDHERGCQGREYVCSCDYDETSWKTAEEAASEITRLRRELEEARRKAFEEAAAIAEEFHFMKDIEWWLNSTKKEISAETCLLLAAAIRQRAEEEGR